MAKTPGSVRICQSLVRKEKVSGQDSGISQDMSELSQKGIGEWPRLREQSGYVRA